MFLYGMNRKEADVCSVHVPDEVLERLEASHTVGLLKVPGLDMTVIIRHLPLGSSVNCAPKGPVHVTVLCLALFPDHVQTWRLVLCRPCVP